MWFKNLQLHRLPAPWAVTPDQLEQWLAPHAFQPGNSVEKQSFGWASPRDDGALVYSINRQMLLTFRAEKKLLPASVVNQVTKARALEMEEQQGFKPGRKQLRELKEQVTDELLPRAFSIRRDTEQCKQCGHCSRTCPMNIDVAHTDFVRHPNCIGCLRCISSCPKGLLKYGLMPGKEKKK